MEEKRSLGRAALVIYVFGCRLLPAPSSAGFPVASHQHVLATPWWGQGRDCGKSMTPTTNAERGAAAPAAAPAAG